MKVHITAVVNFPGKDGREWEKVSYLKANGEAGTAMYERGKFRTPQLDITNAELEGFSVSEVEFDERGRLVGFGN